MKTGIHPEYVEATVTCSCGNTFKTRATKPELHVELCNECHPFFTGKQKLVDTGGRVERFQRRYGRTSFTSKDEETPESPEDEVAVASERDVSAAADGEAAEAPESEAAETPDPETSSGAEAPESAGA